MKRYDAFHQIHKGLRALLYEIALQVQHTDFTNEKEAGAACGQVLTVLALFEKHADSEDNHVFAAIRSWEPSVADAFEQEHETDHALGMQLEAAVTSLSLSADKTASGNQLSRAFVKFMTFNLDHMAREEEVINPILWRYYSDAELHEMTMRIIAGIAPEKLALYNKWMMRGLNNPEIYGWLKEVKNNAPDFIFNALMETAEEELSPVRGRQVTAALTEGALLA